MKMQQKVLKKKIAEIIVSMIMHYSTNFHRFLLCDDEITINYALGGLKYFVLILAFLIVKLLNNPTVQGCLLPLKER